jgi:uncharacterized protein YndB with AHSA1/START domain
MPVTDDRLEQQVHVDAPPASVFPFLTEPEQVARWMGTEAKLDARPGGLYQVHIGPQITALGEFTVVDPPHRVAFTFGWEGQDGVGPGSTTVEITLRPDGDGTLVTLVHRGLPVPAVADHEQGWAQYLPRLATAATGGDPGPDPHAG